MVDGWWLATKFVSAFLLPPLNLLLLSGLGIVLLGRRPRLGRGLILTSWVLLYGLSTPLVGRTLLQSLEYYPPLRLPDVRDAADAIVVLGGGMYCDAPEYAGDSVSGSTLDRLRYAARLHRATGKPILVSGGKPASDTAEAVAMQETLMNDFHVPVQWIEGQSANTLENVRLSATLLQAQGIRRVYVVTHAWHMPRAVAEFEKVGFEVVPAPTAFTTACRMRVLDFLPRTHGLQLTTLALHEWIGRAWYALQW